MLAALALYGSLLVTTAAVAAPAPRTPGFASNNGTLVFWSTRDGNAQIYALSADGSTQTNLSGNPAQEMDPAWSPDGERIAFSRSFNAGGRPDIFVMNADGSGGERSRTPRSPTAIRPGRPMARRSSTPAGPWRAVHSGCS